MEYRDVLAYYLEKKGMTPAESRTTSLSQSVER